MATSMPSLVKVLIRMVVGPSTSIWSSTKLAPWPLVKVLTTFLPSKVVSSTASPSTNLMV